MRIDELGPFDWVLDVGGNIGEFAETCRELWPAARITSFEPLPALRRANEQRAAGRWWVEQAALSDEDGTATIHYCVNQHSASTMQEPGTLRRERFGIRDTFEDVQVRTRRLDAWWQVYGEREPGRGLLKIDVEGHEGKVLAGAGDVLRLVDVVVCEVNQDATIFVGSPSPATIDALLREYYGLFFAGVLASQLTQDGETVQFDGVWSR